MRIVAMLVIATFGLCPASAETVQVLGVVRWICNILSAQRPRIALSGVSEHRPDGDGAMRQDDIRREGGQFGCMSANFGGIGRCPGCRFARCGTPRKRSEIGNRPRLLGGARRCGASARAAAPVRRAAMSPLDRLQHREIPAASCSPQAQDKPS